MISITNPDTIRARFRRYLQTPTTSLYESKLSNGNIGYTLNNSYPTTVVSTIAETDILTITYYDDYSQLTIGGFSALAYDSSYDIDNYTDNDGNINGYFDKVKGQVTGTKMKVLDGNEYTASAKWLCSANYYDDRYRVIQKCRSIYHGINGGKEILSSQYDFTGKLTKSKNVQFFGANTNTVTETNTFDHLERLKLVKHLVNSGTEVTLASLDYNESGQLKQKSLHGAIGSGIQNLNYSYNIRGWLTKINNPDVNPSLTSLQKLNLGLFYNAVPTGFTVGAQYNGNISAIAWNTPLQTGALSPADKQGYGFTYDGLNRMLTSTYGEGTTFATNAGVNNENVTYDLNGNIKTLTRYLKGTGLIDNLTYTYKDGNVSNTLDRVDDAVTGSQGFSESVKQANEYGYDVNGNLTSDANKGYSSILYNYLNLPRRIGTASQYISYLYDAAGTKLAKIGTANDTTYYAGSFIYSGSSLNYILHREGMYLPGGNYQYFLKDHLGNTRLVVNTVGTGGSIVQQTDYYPFGMDIANYNGGLDNKYRYNGKEFQNDVINSRNLQWYDYGARFYDPIIGRWHCVDPSAESYNSISPYVYCGNNPIRLSDLDGRDWLDKVVGFTNAIVDNAIGYNRRGDYSPTDAADYNTGQDMGDVASVLMGASEADTGGGIAAGSVAVTVGSGGLSLEVTAPAFIGGTAMAAHGTFMAGRAVGNLASQKGRVSEGSKEVNGNSKSSTKEQHNYDVEDTWTQNEDGSNRAVKTGTSGGKETKAGESYRGNSQANKWNKQEGTPGRYKSNTTNRVPAGSGARQKALDYEKNRANQVRPQLDPNKHQIP